MFRLTIETVNHKDQAYETLGDYGIKPDGTLWIKVSELGDWRYEFLVGLHEAIEFMLLKARGIFDPGKFTEDFDLKWEETLRFDGIGREYDEPGFDPRSPYRVEHTLADFVEHAVAVKLGVDIDEYYKAQEALYHSDDEDKVVMIEEFKEADED